MRAGIVALAVAALASAFTVVAPTPALAGTSATPGSSTYVALQPCRLVDTRHGLGVDPVDGSTLAVHTRGLCDVPGEATSVAVTLTAVEPSGSGYLTAWPSNGARPGSSNINFAAHQVRANGSIVSLAPDGSFRVFTSVPAQIVVDVVGAFVPATTARAGRFVAISPLRTFDSRSTGSVAAGTSVTVPLPGGVPADAVAIAANITMATSFSAGYVAASPAGRPVPDASILNVDGIGQTRAAAGIVPVSPAGMSLYSSGGGDIVVDVLGYFTGASATPGSDGLFTASDPTRVLDTRTLSPLGTGVPLYPSGGVELAVGHGGSIAYTVTSVDGDAGFVTAFAAGTPNPPTSTVNSTGNGDVANFAITQLSDRGIDLYSQSRTHVLIDVEGWFSGPSVTATLPAPVNTPPSATPRHLIATYSTCTNGGSEPLRRLNVQRSSVGAPALTSRADAEDYACAYALHLAQAGTSSLVHSGQAARDAALGCTTGENIAEATGTSTQYVLDTWFASAPHLANIKDSIWRTVGIAFVTRIEPGGAMTTFGVTDFASC